MKKFMILIAAMAMATLAAQADNVAPATDSVIAMEVETPSPTEGETNGTEVPEGR